MTTQSPLQKEEKVLWFILAFFLLLFILSCEKPEGPDFPITIEPVEGNEHVLFRISRNASIDVWYHNYWDGSVVLLDWWCQDGDGTEWRVVGIGDVCVENDSWCKKLE